MLGFDKYPATNREKTSLFNEKYTVVSPCFALNACRSGGVRVKMQKLETTLLFVGNANSQQ